jgi:hypothetical protein
MPVMKTRIALEFIPHERAEDDGCRQRAKAKRRQARGP